MKNLTTPKQALEREVTLQANAREMRQLATTHFYEAWKHGLLSNKEFNHKMVMMHDRQKLYRMIADILVGEERVLALEPREIVKGFSDGDCVDDIIEWDKLCGDEYNAQLIEHERTQEWAVTGGLNV